MLTSPASGGVKVLKPSQFGFYFYRLNRARSIQPMIPFALGRSIRHAIYGCDALTPHDYWFSGQEAPETGPLLSDGDGNNCRRGKSVLGNSIIKISSYILKSFCS